MAKTTQIIPLALIVVALLTSACGCNTTNSHDTNEEITVEETGNTYIEEADTTRFTPISLRDGKKFNGVQFYQNEAKQTYAYIESWGTYRKLGNIDGEICDVLFDDNAVEIITGNFSRNTNIVLTTWKLARNNEKIETNVSELDMKYDEVDAYFCNYYKENCAYFFYISYVDAHKLIRFETTDGGKTWMNQKNELNISGGTCHAWPEIAKFITKDVGIISYRVLDDEPLKARTYLTTDYGKTWTTIADLPDEKCNSGNVCNLKKIDDKYIMTVRCYDDEYDFYTTDFKSWTLIG